MSINRIPSEKRAQAAAHDWRACNWYHFGLLADDVDQGPVMSRLFDIIDRDGKISGDEIQAALNLPAHAQSISQLIIDYETEWVNPV
ncbi:hypothetical protein AABC73_21305 [Pseudomonas sp. G.S.17]|uniref:hypothetical protein n=1 Tax=Pseudomonas sp. G.S.17 TaxID=3137451 RepID=UPI00311CDD51